MSVQAEITAANAILVKDGNADPTRDSRVIMAHVLGVDGARMTLHLRDDLKEAQQSRFWALIQRRLDREPVSHIIGGRQFYREVVCDHARRFGPAWGYRNID